MDLNDRRVLLIGGAGLIGSHIVDQLIDTPVREIVVFDNFVRGSRANLYGSNCSGTTSLTYTELGACPAPTPDVVTGSP